MADLTTKRDILIALHLARLPATDKRRLARDLLAAAPTPAETVEGEIRREQAEGAEDEEQANPLERETRQTRETWRTVAREALAPLRQAVDDEIGAAAGLGARLVTRADGEYPVALAQLADPPLVLTVRGRLPPGWAVAIVGSRLGDLYGCEVARRFAFQLAAAGVTVVSGLARGIDAAAHEGALAAPGGLTVGVLGCGMGIAYPRGHAPLAAAIADRGAVVSELPSTAPPRPMHFPRRGRIIAALGWLALVVQATPRSGALVTAQQARFLGRPLFAVPGGVFEPLSSGPHDLLRRGTARIAACPEDLLNLLAHLDPPGVRPAGAGDSAGATGATGAIGATGAKGGE